MDTTKLMILFLVIAVPAGLLVGLYLNSTNSAENDRTAEIRKQLEEERERERQEKLKEDEAQRQREKEIEEEERKRTEALEKAKNDLLGGARSMVLACIAKGNKSPVVRAPKVMIWDDTTQKLSPVHDQLPAYMQGTFTDTELTVFLVTKVNNVKVQTYSGINTSGYRVDHTVCVVRMPQKQVLGCYVVQGNGPPSVIFRKGGDTSPAYGEWIKPFTEWVQKAPVDLAGKGSR